MNFSQNTSACISYSQQYCWDTLYGDAEYISRYFVTRYMLEVQGSIDLEIFEKALHECINRNNILKSHFSINEGELLLEVDNTSNSYLTIVTAEECASNNEALLLNELVQKEIGKEFDLFCGPLFRCTLVEVPSCKILLIFSIHHMVFDVASYGVLMAELDRLYMNIASE